MTAISRTDGRGSSSGRMMPALLLMLALVGVGLLLRTSYDEYKKSTEPTMPTKKEERLLEEYWGEGRNVENMRQDLYLDPEHGLKHELEKLPGTRVAKLLQTYACVTSRKFLAADNSGREFYLCRDPVSGQLGGIFVNPDGSYTGYGTSKDMKFVKEIIRDQKWQLSPEDWAEWFDNLTAEHGWRPYP